MDVPGPWRPADSAQLRRAVAQAGHEQTRVGVVLEREFGLSQAPAQSTVSRWMSGRSTPSPSARTALRSYSERFAPAAEVDATESPGDSWEASVRQMSGEPLLGPRQARLVDAVLHRLERGDITDSDVAVIESMSQVLGLE